MKVKDNKKVNPEDKRGLKNKGGNKRTNKELPESEIQTSKQAKLNSGDNPFAAIGDQMDNVPIEEPTSAKINLEINKNLEKVKQLLLTSTDHE